MNILPLEVITAGPGVDLSDQPEGLAVKMSDPVADFENARNAVTLVYDLSDYDRVRLSFEAMEFGDEPHFPKNELGIENSEDLVGFGPVADFDFDGVAISVDGVNWYEAQDLRHLRSDRFTAFDLDLDAVLSALGLVYGGEFRIRFCQVDDNPAPMDGISLHRIALTGEFPGLYVHLPMDDNAADPTVHDATPAHQDQTFLDPGGDPNTSAHSVPGAVGRALAFDGVDDIIDMGTDVDAVLGEGQDFTLSCWWKWNGTPGVVFPDHNTFLDNRVQYLNHGLWFAGNLGTTGLLMRIYRSDGSYLQGAYFGGWTDGGWRHVVVQREGDTFRWYVNNVARGSDTEVRNSNTLVSRDFKIGGTYIAGQACPCAMNDFRVYNRALPESEIQILYNLGNIA